MAPEEISGPGTARPMIEIRNLKKEFLTRSETVTALDGINLRIEAGDIYGIIGMSGAGKSTLVRCMNLLEKPTEGEIFIDGQDIAALPYSQLLQLRRSVAMIFQQFNLLMQRSVIKNVQFPLEIAGWKKPAAQKRALELLRLVGLEEKKDAYPSQLSGGQKQRVAIARALALKPKVLLSDEATSALDPVTTRSILALLQKINREMGITIVVITHQMHVIREICHHVAVMNDSRLIETGTVEKVLLRPDKAMTRKLFNSFEFTGSSGEPSLYYRVSVPADRLGALVTKITEETKEPVKILQSGGAFMLEVPDNEPAASQMGNWLKANGIPFERVETDVES